MVASIVACGSFLAAEDAPGGPGSGDASADAATAARRTAGSKRTPGQTARGTGASFAGGLLHADAEEAGEGDHACDGDGDAEAARRFGGETDLEPFASPSIKRSVSPSSAMPS